MLVVVLLTVDCSRFGGALLPTSFEQIIKHRQEGGGEEVAVAHTPPKECQYQVLSFLCTTHLSPSMVEWSTSSSPRRASDADDGVVLRPPRGLLWFNSWATADVRRTCSRGPHYLRLGSPPGYDMDDRCCCGTVLIGAAVPRHTAGVRLDDSSDAGWTNLDL